MAKSSKGAEWERLISKSLSLWWSEGAEDDLFWRTSQSGGRATQRRKKGLSTSNSYGDITSTHPSTALFIETFVLELKRGYTKENLGILGILDGPKRKNLPLLFEFWNQCEKDKISGGRLHSLVMFKRDRRKQMILFRQSLYMQLCSHFDPPISAYRSIIRCPEEYGIPHLILMRLDDWFKWINPVKLQTLLEHKKIR